MNHPYKLIIFDVDGTLRYCTVQGQPCPNKPGEWELMPHVKERLDALDRARVMFGVASNQAGVGLGYMSNTMATKLIYDTVKAAFGEVLHHNAVQICPHKPDAGCECRKPSPVMLNNIMEWYRCVPEQTLYVGDMAVDEATANAAGCHFEYASVFFNWGADSLWDHHNSKK